MLVSAAALSFAIWVYLTLAHGQFWRVSRFVMPEAVPETSNRAPTIAAVVPARNEADVVGQCMSSLLDQHGLRIHVVLVDDASTDGTLEAALAAAQKSGSTNRLTVIQGQPLPAGWSGKLWAMQQGIERAQALEPDFFLLTDADIVHSPNHVQSLAAIAQSHHHDLVSVMVKLHCETAAERALIPAFVFFFLMLYPPAWIADQRRKTAGAAGGCILVRPAALQNAGGIAAIHQEIIDDCALARRVKNTGGSVLLGLSTNTRSIRPYGSFAAIGRMISRAAFNQLRHSTLLLLATLIGLTITYVAPPALLFSGHMLCAAIAGAAWLLMALCFLPTIRLYKLHPSWSLALPAIALFYMGATLHSAFKYWSGKGGEWKGRVQDPAGTHS